MARDSHGLGVQLAAIARGDRPERWQGWQSRFVTSLEKVHNRQLNLPAIDYPDLPVSARRDDIIELIRNHQVVVIAGETGSGKTTQLPKLCLEAGRGVRGLIGHTQPRRIAARSVAARIAEELKSELGDKVGYQVRFNDQTSPESYIKLMTDGILLAEIPHDRFLTQYDTIIIDEAHERSLNIDFLLGYLKTLLPKRPDLKLVITSATIDVEKFSRHFADAPVVEVSGRTYPVSIEYRPPFEEDNDIYQGIVAALEEIRSLPQQGDVLVFCHGEGEIREAALAIKRAQFRDLDVLPLYARLSLQEQSRVFAPRGRGQRVILATNVAETSLTVPGIRYVIDTGRARISRYSYRTKVQRLPIEPVSQASANQRAGRCGRLSDGVCYRLYSEDDFNNRPQFTDPEIVRTNLAAVILQMLHLRIGDIRKFPFVDPPDHRLINDGFKLLEELQALNGKGNLTAIGKQLIRLPVDPRIGRMLIAAEREGSLPEMLVIAAAMSIQDPRDRPADKRQAADEKHRQWQDEKSDFGSLLKLWLHMEEKRVDLSRNKFSDYCHKNFVSYLRMREWRDLHHQLHNACRELGWKQKSAALDSEGKGDAIHRALLAGLLSQVGFRDQEREYAGTRNRRFAIFPGSALHKKQPKWVMAAEMLETSRLFATTVAEINVDWLPELARHLVKHHYSEPHYHVKSGQVMAFEKQTLYGLPVVEGKRVPFGSKDPVLAREIFIQQCLVENGYKGKGKFFNDNQSIIEELHEVEMRIRKRDVLADDREIFAFYDERIPPGTFNLAAFEHWRKEAEQRDPNTLRIPKERLLRRALGDDEIGQFPKSILWEGIEYPLSYHFEPGHAEDGLSVNVPVALLHQIPRYRFDWLVPGMVRDKCIALVKGLPKQERRQFVPVPDYVDKALVAMTPADQPLWQALSHQLHRASGIKVADQHWQAVVLEDWCRCNYRLLDEQGGLLARGRDIEELQQRFRDRIKQGLQSNRKENLTRDGITQWDFGDLPEQLVIPQGQVKITAWPALEDRADSVAIVLKENPLVARSVTQHGLYRLFRLTHSEPERYLRKQLFRTSALSIAGSGIEKNRLIEESIAGAYWHALFGPGALQATEHAFAERVAAAKTQVVPLATEFEAMLVEQCGLLLDIRKGLKGAPFNAVFAVEDIKQQLHDLYRDGFICQTDADQLRQYSRYLRAVQIRQDKFNHNLARERTVQAELAEWRQRLSELEPHSGLPTQLLSDIARLHTMIEEYRVSLFAQQLKTAFPVSDKRLNAIWREVAEEYAKHPRY